MGIGSTHETSPGVTTTLRRKPVLGRLPTGRMEGDGTWASADSQSCATIHGPTYMSVLCNHPWTYLYVSPVQPSKDLHICQSRATNHGPTDLSVLCNHPSSSDRRSNSHRAVIGDQTLIEQRSEIKLGFTAKQSVTTVNEDGAAHGLRGPPQETTQN